MYNDLNDFKVKINESESTITICGLKIASKTLHKIDIAPSYKYQGVEYKVVALENTPIFNSLTTEVNLPHTIKKIGLHAFDNTNNLCNINVDENNEKFSSVDGVLFNKAKSILIKFPTRSQLRKYNVPDTVHSIKEGAFQDAFYLEEVNMSDKVQTIGAMAFQKCKFLRKVKISDKIDKFDRRLFSCCPNLKEVNIPKGVNTIAAYAFENCRSLDIKVPDEIHSIGMGAFCGSGMTSFCLPKESKINFLHGMALAYIELDLFYIDVNTFFPSDTTSIIGEIENFVIGKNFDYTSENFTKLFKNLHSKTDIKNIFIFCEKKEFEDLAPIISCILTSKGTTQVFIQNIEDLEEKGFDYGQINQILKGYDKGILLNYLPIDTDATTMRRLIAVFEKDKKAAFDIMAGLKTAEKIINPYGKAEKYSAINKKISEILSEEIERGER